MTKPSERGYLRFPCLRGERIVFVCEDDLWSVSSSGGRAERLTAGVAEAVRPCLSPDGRTLAFVGKEEGPSEVFVMPAEGGRARRLTYQAAAIGFLGFSRDGRSVIQLERNSSGVGAPWRLWSTDVETGADRLLADVPVPETAGDVAGFSLHPDGTRFLTSIARWPFDIWMLEGFDRK